MRAYVDKQRARLQKKWRQRVKKAAAIKRSQKLKSLRGNEDMLWLRVENFVFDRAPESYEMAAALLEDLKKLHKPAKMGELLIAVVISRGKHARKGNF